MRTIRAAIFSVGWLACCGQVVSQTSEQQSALPQGNINLATPTLGGKQFWADELLFHHWRIQRNVFSGHHRLLDASDVRRGWGSFDECRAALEAIKRRDNLPPMKRNVVIVLHGLWRTRSAMSGLAKAIEQTGKYTTLAVGYPSTMAEVEEHAKSLALVIENLEAVDEISFVAHSLGNLVIRRYLDDQLRGENARLPDPRIKRIVMLGAPNNGAQIAVILGGNKLTREFIGQPGRELADGWDELSKHLATPQCEFAIIAGGKGDGQGYNPLLPGDDDLVVTVDETRLPGARDFLCLPVMHTFMMDDKLVQQATLKFLQHGYLVDDNQRNTIDKPK